MLLTPAYNFKKLGDVSVSKKILKCNQILPSIKAFTVFGKINHKKQMKMCFPRTFQK